MADEILQEAGLSDDNSIDGTDDDNKDVGEWARIAESDEDEDPLSGLGEPAGEEGSGKARMLSQEEIDSLLNIQSENDDRGDSSGIFAILNSALVSYERLPMLEIVFDRMVRMLSTSLRNFTSDNVEVSLDHISSVRFGDYLNSIPLPAMLSVFKAEEWDNYGLIASDSALIYSIVDVLLGGRRGSTAMRVEGRPYTTIERNLVTRMLHVVLGDLSGAFDPLSPVTFRFERLETNPRFATIARPGNAAVVAKLRIDMEDRGGRMELLLPYATLEPVRELLLQQFMGEKFGRDSIWEGHLVSELWMTHINLEAVMGDTTATLGDVLNWKVGDRIDFPVNPGTPITLACGGVRLFDARMGQKKSHVAGKIIGRVIEEA